MQTALPALIVACVVVGCQTRPGPEEASLGNAAVSGGFLVTLEFHGAETGNWHRAGFCTQDRALDLEKWRRANWIMREYFVTAIITEEEAARLRSVLGRDSLLTARQARRPEGLSPQQFVIAVSDKTHRYYVPIGLDAKTLQIVVELKRALEAENSQSLERIIKQLSRFGEDARPSRDRGESN